MRISSIFTIPGFPRQLMSKATGLISRAYIPRFLRRPLWGYLIKLIGIEGNTISGDLIQHKNFTSLFTRHLPENSRPIPENDDWLSPSDGVLVEHSSVTAELSLTLKGTPYSLRELLPFSPLENYYGYQALQIYLAPYNYHRFHAPCELNVISAITEPGDLQPVAPKLIRRSMRIIKKNRRIILHCKDKNNRSLALIYVGALNVGRMQFTFDKTLGQSFKQYSTREYDPPIKIARGDDMGCFEMGSTVVLLAPPELDCKIKINETTTAKASLLTNES